MARAACQPSGNASGSKKASCARHTSFSGVLSRAPERTAFGPPFRLWRWLAHAVQREVRSRREGSFIAGEPGDDRGDLGGFSEPAHRNALDDRIEDLGAHRANHVGPDVPGRDGIHRDALRRHLLGQRHREAVNARLGRRSFLKYYYLSMGNFMLQLEVHPSKFIQMRPGMPACPTNALPGDPIEGNLAVRCLAGTQPVDINFESGGNPREDIERRNCNSLAPKLHIALTYVEPLGGASGADASPFQGEPQGCALGYCPHRYAQGARWFERVDSYRWISLRKCLYSRRRLLNELVKFTPALLEISRPNMAGSGCHRLSRCTKLGDCGKKASFAALNRETQPAECT